ncbi:Limulus clotting factor C, partial [Orchesella cincta]
MPKCQNFARIEPLIKLLVLFISVVVINSQNRILSPCKHNQFRCSEGICIKSESLCNGRRDCNNGEDERGGPGWNCRSTSLAKDLCDPATQFRCRFGGCIPRTSLCNGYADCWGGSDEAVDVCVGGQPKIPQVSGGSVSQYQPPPQTQRPQPVNTTPRSTRPPFFQTQPPQPVQITDRSPIPVGGGGGGFGACGPIREDPTLGYKVTCENSRFYEVDCGDAPAGGIANYQCQKYYTATSSLLTTTTRRCENGRWTSLNNRFGCEPVCGISASDTGAFIVGGSTAKSGRWPWMVAIYERSTKGTYDFICGASLISPKAVITAAHCVVRRDSGETKRFNELKLVMGKYYRSYDRKSTGEQERKVVQIFVHNDYSRVTLRNDIAIIRIDPVEITEFVRPICLPTQRDYTEPDQYGTLVGWGRGTGNSFQEQLQQALLPVVLNQKCTEAHPQFAHLVHPGTFCAGYRNGTSACDGDS